MTVTVEIDLGYEFEVNASVRDVFDVLSDVPTSVSHFPNVDELIDLGDGVYQWQMARVGTAKVNIQTVYASKYVSNRAKGSVVWTPVEGVGNSLVGGSWAIKNNKGHAAITLSIQAQINVQLPSLMQMVVGPVVQIEFEKMVEKYIDNLIARFGGEV